MWHNKKKIAVMKSFCKNSKSKFLILFDSIRLSFRYALQWSRQCMEVLITGPQLQKDLVRHEINVWFYGHRSTFYLVSVMQCIFKALFSIYKRKRYLKNGLYILQEFSWKRIWISSCAHWVLAYSIRGY